MKAVHKCLSVYMIVVDYDIGKYRVIEMEGQGHISDVGGLSTLYLSQQNGMFPINIISQIAVYAVQTTKSEWMFDKCTSPRGLFRLCFNTSFSRPPLEG